MKNRHVSQQEAHIDHLLDYMRSGSTFPYDAGAGPRIIARAQANYARLYALYEDILTAGDEGVTVVTIKSATQTITLPVTKDGSLIDSLLVQVGEQLRMANEHILMQLKDQAQTISERGDYNDKPEDAAIHALCMPPTSPATEQPASAPEPERCPFLPEGQTLVRA